MNGRIKAPVVYDWAMSVAVLLSDIGDNYDEPIWIEPQNRKQYPNKMESDSDEYIARNIWERQMRYEESDRYPTTAGLRYGM